MLPFDFSHCSYERERGSSGLTGCPACVELPSELLCVICCDANSSVKRLAKLIASDPHTVWWKPIGMGFEARVWRCLLTIFGGFGNLSIVSSP